MPAANPDSWVEWQGRRRPLPPGSIVTFGRSAACDLVIGGDDALVSRRAGRLHRFPDHLEIANTSTKRELRLRPPIGPEVVVPPLASGTSRGMTVFQIVVTGRYDHAYVLGCRGPRAFERPPEADEGATTAIRPFELSAPERAMLRELCRPMLLSSGGAAQPATYAQVGAATGRSDRYARNVLKGIRDRLTAHGLPGLVPSDRTAASDLRRPLCEFAIANGWAFDD